MADVVQIPVRLNPESLVFRRKDGSLAVVVDPDGAIHNGVGGARMSIGGNDVYVMLKELIESVPAREQAAFKRGYIQGAGTTAARLNGDFGPPQG